MRFAYADPPYPGCAHYYRGGDPDAREVNHRILIGWLCDEFPDGWALSTSSVALREVLPLCPADARVAAWCKPFASWKLGGKSNKASYAWEPVIFWRGSTVERTKRLGVVCRDYLLASPPLRQRVPGEKPHRFAWWIFQMLGAGPGDEVVDVFPGSGAITEAWRAWCGEWDDRQTLFEGVA